MASDEVKRAAAAHGIAAEYAEKHVASAAMYLMDLLDDGMDTELLLPEHSLPHELAIGAMGVVRRVRAGEIALDELNHLEPTGILAREFLDMRAALSSQSPAD